MTIDNNKHTVFLYRITSQVPLFPRSDTIASGDLLHCSAGQKLAVLVWNHP